MNSLTATAGLGLAGLGFVYHTLYKGKRTGREPWDPSKDTTEYDYIILGGKDDSNGITPFFFVLQTRSIDFFPQLFWLNRRHRRMCLGIQAE